jgi:hypothetical protein
MLDTTASHHALLGMLCTRAILAKPEKPPMTVR